MDSEVWGRRHEKEVIRLEEEMEGPDRHLGDAPSGAGW